MGLFSFLFKKKVKPLPEDEVELPPAPKITKSVILGDESMIFFRALRSLFHPANSSASPNHQMEFKKIEKVYTDHINENSALIVEGSFPSLTLELTQSFYDTWMPMVFNEAFRPHQGLKISEAKALNDLFRTLNNQQDHPSFLRNHNQYYIG